MTKLFRQVIVALVLLISCSNSNAEPPAPIDIDSRLELFVDDYFVDRFDGEASRHLHKPRGREIVLEMDKPWEDPTWGYFSVFLDGDIYRMYYRGHHHGSMGDKPRGEPMCYAESKDG